MRITVWGINYAPEPTGIGPYNTALCRHLRQAGHTVRMVTSFPYYPAWRKSPADRWRWARTERVEGVTVHRCWHYVPRRVRTWTRILHEGSFVATSLLRQLSLPRADVLVVVSPPLLLGAAAWLVSKVRRTPFVFHVQDLQPDAAAGLGLLRRGWLLRLLRYLERFAYRQAAQVSGITPGMVRAFGAKGVPPERQCHFPNPVLLPPPSSLPARGRFRLRSGIAADDFLVVYSGNLGVKQGLDSLVAAARRVRRGRIRIVICGDGSRREPLQAQVKAQALGNVAVLPLQSEERYHELLVDADLCVIPQQAGAGSCFFPSKLLNTLALGRPVLAVAEPGSELVEALAEGGFGVQVPPGNPDRIARALEDLSGQPERLQTMGEAGRRYVEQFELRRVLSRFEAALRQVAAGWPAGTEVPGRTVLLPAPAAALAPAEPDQREAA